MLVLDVPFSKKNEAKRLGAIWNPEIKSWLVPNKNTLSETLDFYQQFATWFNGPFLIQNNLYLLEAKRVCWKCNKITNVIAFALDSPYILEDGKWFQSNQWIITNLISNVPESLFNFINTNYNFKEKYSKTIKQVYVANCCEHCDALQGNNFLFHEPFDSPFYLDSKERLQNARLLKPEITLDITTQIDEILPLVLNFSKKEFELEVNESLSLLKQKVEQI